MLNVITTNQFKKDMQKCQSRKRDMAKLKAVIEILQIPAPLPFENKDHKLTNYGKKKEAFRDCHIEPDWVLIYR